MIHEWTAAALLAFSYSEDPELALACWAEANDPRELAIAFAQLERHEDEIVALASAPLDDPADHFNLVMALRDSGRPGTESLLREVLSRTHPSDGLYPYVLAALSEELAESDPEQAWAISEHAFYLFEESHGTAEEDALSRSP